MVYLLVMPVTTVESKHLETGLIPQHSFLNNGQTCVPCLFLSISSTHMSIFLSVCMFFCIICLLRMDHLLMMPLTGLSDFIRLPDISSQALSLSTPLFMIVSHGCFAFFLSILSTCIAICLYVWMFVHMYICAWTTYWWCLWTGLSDFIRPPNISSQALSLSTPFSMMVRKFCSSLTIMKHRSRSSPVRP